MSRLTQAVALALLALFAGRAPAQLPLPPRTPIAASSAPAAASRAPAVLPAAVAPDPRLADDALLLFDVSLGTLSLTDSLATYATPGGPLIPLGELTRLLDVDIAVSPPERRVTGTVGEARRPVLIDLATGLIRLDGKSLPFHPGDIAVGPTDIYVRPALLERILPVTVTIDEAGLRILLRALEPLPIQSRLDRLARLRSLQPDVGAREDVLRVATPHRLISLPAFDVSLAAALDHGGDRRKTPRRYDIRAGADVLFTGFQGYLGSDDTGTPRTARALFERRDPSGRMFGPLGITRASAGDIFTPTLAMGPRSLGGRGVSFTTAPLEQASVFQRIDLRGELPIGYDVELYVNDVLRSGQQTPVRGRYEFLDVPLVRGTNLIRVVSYGPRGERNEEVRVISVGGGQLAKGAAVVDFGVAQQDRNLIDLDRRGADPIFAPGTGRLRVAANLAYGLTTRLTLVGGAGTYSPNGRGERGIATVGVRTSLRGLAAQADAAHDSKGGTGVLLGLAGQPFGLSMILRHGEYRGGFVDETIPRGGDGRALTRYSDLTVDATVVPFGRQSIPLSGRLARDEFANGDRELSAIARASSALGRALVSAGLDYTRLDRRRDGSSDRLRGNVSASTFAAFAWQLRASLDYDLLPNAHLRATTLSADRSIGPRTAIRIGLGHSFERDRTSTVQASAIFRLPVGDLSLDAAYGTPDRRWRVGLAFAFSLGYDPLGRRYVARRIGAGSGGNLAVQSFVDRNGNGRYDRGETPVAGVAVRGGLDGGVTDARGRAFLTGLGYAPVARVQTDIDDIDLPYVASPPRTIEFTPRAGVTTVAMYPLKPQGEALVRLLFRQPDGRLVGLSAVRLRLVDAAGAAREGSTEYDGSVSFDNLASGSYRVEIDPAQAARLKMRLAEPLEIVVPAGGGVLPERKAVVAFDQP